MGAATAKRPACPECGSGNVFAAIDVRWKAETQRWEINQTRMADDCTEIDCMDCDHRAMLDDGGFPDPCEHVTDKEGN